MSFRSIRSTLTSAATAVVCAFALAACGSGGPRTDAEKLARGRELVQQMSSHLAAISGATVASTEVREIARGSSPKETVSVDGSYTLRRPDRFHTRMTGGHGLESWYNGKILTIAAHNDKVFAQAPMPENIDRTLDALAERYDMALPLADLFHSDPAKALLSDSTTGGYVDEQNVGNTPCHHLRFFDTGVEWELWLPVSGDPLPKRFKVTQKSRTGSPVTDVTFTAWTIASQIPDTAFAPKVPADYEGIALIQRAAAVKHTATPGTAAPAQ